MNFNGLIPWVHKQATAPERPLFAFPFFPLLPLHFKGAKTNRLNVAKSAGVLAWGVTFTLVYHHDGPFGSYFHSGVGIDAQDNPPTHALPTLTAVDDGLFTLHHGVIRGTFLLALRTHSHSLGRLAGYCLLEPRLLMETLGLQQVCVLERTVRRPVELRGLEGL